MVLSLNRYFQMKNEFYLLVGYIAHHITAGINVLISVWLSSKGGINAGLDVSAL